MIRPVLSGFRFSLFLLVFCALMVACAEGEDLAGDLDGDADSSDGDDVRDTDGDLDNDGDVGPDGDEEPEDGDSPDNPDGDEELPVDGDDEVPPIDHDYPDSEASENLAESTEYLIVSPPEMVAAWQELADWKTRKGVPTQVVGMDRILSESSGRDDAESLRNWLMSQGEVLPLRYVLLGGNTPAVPHREFFFYTDVFGVDYYDGILASDLYFADWHGSWDANENNVWAEMDDDLLLIPDVSLTRLPFDSAEEVSGYVAKLLTYEQNPPSGYVTDVLFLSEDTGFSGIDSAWGLDPLSRDIFPDRFSFTKLYHDPSPFADAELNTWSAQIEALQAGPHFVVHFGHGGGEDVGYMDREDLESLSNDPRNSVYISTACYSGGFHDEDRAGGSSFVVNPNGGGVAYFGNTNVGIGFPSGMGFITRFLKLLFGPRQTVRNLGLLNDQARHDFTLDSNGNSKMYLEGHPDRWTVLGMAVFADPEMPIWIAEPRVLTITAPAELHVGKNRVQVRVATDNAKPLVGARVTLWDGEGNLFRALTDDEGQAELRIRAEGGNAFFLTITANDHLPYETTLPVGDGQPLTEN